MGKYDRLKYLRKTKAQTSHQCDLCNVKINSGENYYVETIDSRFLHSLHAKRYCHQCYSKHGDKLLSSRLKEDTMNKRSLLKYFKNCSET